MAPSAADILAGTGESVALKELVGQVITVVDFEEKESKKFNSTFVILEALNAEGEEIEVRGGGWLAPKLRKLQKHGFLPLDCKVVSFETDKGSDGYGLEPAE